MIDDIVTEQYGKRLVTHERFRAEDGIAEAAHILLADVMDFDGRRLLHELQQVRLPLATEFRLELGCRVEMVFDGALAVAADDQDVLDAARERLFDDVLNRRLVDDGQHLFRRRLRGRQARAITGRRNDGLADFLHELLSP